MTPILSLTFAPPRTTTKGCSGSCSRASARSPRAPAGAPPRPAAAARDAHGGGVGAVRGAEGVVRRRASASRASARASSGSLPGLAGLEAAVLEHQHLARRRAGDAPARPPGRPPPAACSTRRAPSARASRRGDRRHRQLGLAVLRAGPRCETSTSCAPALAQMLDRRQGRPDAGVVGDLDRRRASSSGTLKSTRTSTRLPSTSTSLTVFFGDSRRRSVAAEVKTYDRVAVRAGPLEHLRRQVHQAARVAPLVVVPGEHLHEGSRPDHREPGVEDRRVGRLVDVGGDDRILGVGQDARVTIRSRRPPGRAR